MNIFLFNPNGGMGHSCMFHTFTEQDEQNVITVRRDAAHRVQYWSELRKATKEREFHIFIKEQIKAAQRMEKACNIWLSYYLEVGYRTASNFPEELGYELNVVFGVIYNGNLYDAPAN